MNLCIVRADTYLKDKEDNDTMWTMNSRTFIQIHKIDSFTKHNMFTSFVSDKESS